MGSRQVRQERKKGWCQIALGISYCQAVNSSGRQWESRGSGMVLESPSPQQQHIVQGETGQGRLVLLSFTLGSWMETAPGFAPPGHGHFSCAAFVIPWGELPGQRDHQLQAGRVGSCPCPGEVGLEDGGEGWQMDEGQGCPQETSSMWRTVHLLCSIPPRRVLPGPRDRTNLPSVPPADPRHGSLWLHLPKAVYFITTRLRAECR